MAGRRKKKIRYATAEETLREINHNDSLPGKQTGDFRKTEEQGNRVIAVLSLGARVMVVNLHYFVPPQYRRPRAVEFLTTKLMPVNPH